MNYGNYSNFGSNNGYHSNWPQNNYYNYGRTSENRNSNFGGNNNHQQYQPIRDYRPNVFSEHESYGTNFHFHPRSVESTRTEQHPRVHFETDINDDFRPKISNFSYNPHNPFDFSSTLFENQFERRENSIPERNFDRQRIAEEYHQPRPIKSISNLKATPDWSSDENGMKLFNFGQNDVRARNDNNWKAKRGTDLLFHDGWWRPRADIFEIDDTLRVEFELPGVPKENINLKLLGDVLTLSSVKPITKKEESEGAVYYQNERHFGQFYRRLLLPNKCDPHNLHAHLDNSGILRITLHRLDDDDDNVSHPIQDTEYQKILDDNQNQQQQTEQEKKAQKERDRQRYESLNNNNSTTTPTTATTTASGNASTSTSTTATSSTSNPNVGHSQANQQPTQTFQMNPPRK